jgi:uncharacterized protein
VSGGPARAPDADPGRDRGVVLVAGSGGMIGRALTRSLVAGGGSVRRLVRRAPRDADERHWDPVGGVLDPAVFDGVDAVVHLGGESLAERRWSPARRRVIAESRVASTMRLAMALAGRAGRPRTLIVASAVGIFGDRGEEWLDESSPPGHGFLAELAAAWEAAARPAAEAGVRVVQPRFGLVLDPRGGALAPLVHLTRFGLGGPLGSGRQWWPWVTIDDVVEALLFALDHDDLTGPFVLAADATRQRDFASTLARVLGRPAWMPAPAFALRVVLGGMADEMLLASQRVRPVVLERARFRFRDPVLEPALRRVLVSPS